MAESLETLVSGIKGEIQELNQGYRAAFDARRKQVVDAELKHRQDEKQGLKQLEDEMKMLNGQLHQITTYYNAYIGDASDSVLMQVYTPKPVRMTVYTNQLSNYNRSAAAAVIIPEAMANMAYIKQRQDAIQAQIDELSQDQPVNLTSAVNDSLKKQVLAEWLPRYRQVFAQESMRRVQGIAGALGKHFGKVPWDTLSYAPPEKATRKLALGATRRSLKIPEEIHTRLGAVPEALVLPIGVSLSAPFRVFVNYHMGQALATKEGVRTFLGNLLLASTPKTMQVTFLDLETCNGAVLGQLEALCGSGTSFLTPVPTDEEQAEAALAKLEADCNATLKTISGYPNLEAYNAQHAPQEHICSRLLVIFGWPERLSYKGVSSFQKLFYSSPQCGLSIMVVHNQSGELPGGSAKTLMDNIRESALVIDSCLEGQFMVFDGEKAPFRWYSGLQSLSPTFLSEAKDAYTTVVDKDAFYDTSAFREIRHTLRNRHMKLAFGQNETGTLQSFPFEGMNFAAYVSGSAGSGKSTLLHTMIASILLTMHPDDVDLWLVDFKMTEFQLYARYMPPHVKHVILENSQEVVLDLIDELTDILGKRMELMSRYHFKDVIDMPEDLRRKHFPLIVVIVDEFATMSQIVANAPTKEGKTYKELLENLLAKGRAPGFRFIFSDQSFMAGLSGLSEKGKNQIGSRFALANASVAEMKATLSLPDELSEQGKEWMEKLPPHYVLFAEKRKNEGELLERTVLHQVKVEYFSDDKLKKLIDALNRRYQPVTKAAEVGEHTYLGKKPLTFDGQLRQSFTKEAPNIAAYQQSIAEENEEGINLYAGRPCRMKLLAACSLYASPGENLVILEKKTEVLQSLLFSCMASAGSEEIAGRGKAKVLTLCSGYCKAVAKNRRQWQKLGEILDEDEEICAAIRRLRQEVEEGSVEKTLLVFPNLYPLMQLWADYPAPPKKTSLKTFSSSKPAPLHEPEKFSFHKPEKGDGGIGALLQSVNFGLDAKEAESSLPPLPPLPDFDLKPLGDAGLPTAEVSAEAAEEPGAGLYNVTEDFLWLLRKGPSNGVFVIAALSGYSEYKELKLSEKYFRHVLYSGLAKDEVTPLLGLGHYRPETEGAERYLSKTGDFSVRPYLWPGVTIADWTLDEQGNPVKVATDDPFAE